MTTVTTVAELKSLLGKARERSETIGLVPTMGALHQGHIALVQRARKENNLVVVSVFVNPTQFNDKGDLERYPRTLDADKVLLEKAGCDIVFAPSVEEVYPEPDTRIFDFGVLDKVMEGAHRPGHFNGVAQVVSKLFYITSPTRAYFGEKDFQQLAIVKSMVKQLDIPVQVVPCPIVRESDGLAMSSRNTLLTSDQRRSVPLIAKTLFKAVDMVCDVDLETLKNFVIKEVNSDPFLKVEYFDVVNVDTLQPVKSLDDEGAKQACIAVMVGKIRLIDNVRLT